jgi:hypothetical protein
MPAQVDLEAFRATLPTEKENKAGELVRSPCAQFQELSRKLYDEQPHGVHSVVAEPPPLSLWERKENVLDHGWPDNDPELAAWLNKIYAGEWVGMVKEAVDLPPGMIEDMRNLTYASSESWQAKEITVVLAVRGLERQAAGDDEVFVENFRMGLKLSLAMRHRAPSMDVSNGRESEVLLLKGLDRWLERLHGRPDLLHQALDDLSHYADATAQSDEDQDLMEDLMIMNTVHDPLRWLEYNLTVYNDSRTLDPSVQTEALWVATAWLAPWEHERQQRVLRVIFWGDDAQRKALRPDTVGSLWWFVYGRAKPNKLTNIGLERAGILKLALRWYQADNGKLPETLDPLVPKYLPSLPIDPFDPEGKPFHYRLSRGEEIEWPKDSLLVGGSISPPDATPKAAAVAPENAVWPPPAPRLTIPAGQGVLWSVGPDKIDDGGHRQAGGYDGFPVNMVDVKYDKQDIIYLVPLPPKGK